MDERNSVKKVKQSKARKQIKNMENKYKNGYLVKLWVLRITIILISLIVVFFIINSIKWIDDINKTDISSLNASKYSEEILLNYNKEGQKEKFEKYITDLESSIAVYLINNTTASDNSFKNLVKEVEKDINSKDWSKFNLNKDEYYNGKYILDEQGNLKFKFAIKEIEPTWAKDSKYIILN